MDKNKGKVIEDLTIGVLSLKNIKKKGKSQKFRRKSQPIFI
jgi:hypothetical protein